MHLSFAGGARYVLLTTLFVCFAGERSRAGETASLSNLSVRTTLAANQTLIVGGVVGGGEKNILVRAGGPALVKFGVNGMPDPRLSLYMGGSSPVASNDDWPAALASSFAAVGAFEFDPGSKDAALTHSLNGGFTVQAAGSASGTVIVEAYDLGRGISPRMINVSARNRVGTGDDILIAGFSLSGTGKKKMLIRAVGPGLGAFGVTGALTDPILRVFDSKNAQVAFNDNWDSSLAGTAAEVGAFALTDGSRDAALLISLAAGASYSVQVSGASGGTGEALIEIYEVPDPLAEARLPVASNRFDVALGFPRLANRLPATGAVRIKAIFVDFSDAPATRTPQSVFGIISPNGENFFRAISYDRLHITLDPSFQWLRMSKPSNAYGWPGITFAQHKAYIQEALNLAQAAGADFSTSDAFVVLANPNANALTSGPGFCASRGNGVTASGKIFENGATSGRDLITWGYKWFNHEIGHTLSLVDLYAFAGLTHRFVGDFSLMGKITETAPEFFAWERWQLGWLDDDQVVCPERGQSIVALTAVETKGGVKMIVVPTGPSSAIVVESRRPLGFDTGLPQPGVLVYSVDTAIQSGTGVIKVLPENATETRHLSALLSPAQMRTHAGVEVKYIGGDSTTMTVQVTRP